MLKQRNRFKVFVALVCCYFVVSPSQLFADSVNKRLLFLKQSAPWNPEGQAFESYGQFKDDVIFSMRTAIKRIIVASMYVSDNDIMAALYSARARGIKVTILLDKYANRATQSRVRPHLPHVVYTNLDAEEMEGDTTLVVDRSVWRVNVALDVNCEDRVRIDRSPYTAPEVEAWIKRGQYSQPPRDLKSRESANPSTSDVQPKLRIFGNIKKTNESSTQDVVPRALPRETKWQKLDRGVDTELLHGDAPNTKVPNSPVKPEASSRESDLNL